MKKTIIALMALAGVAMAEEITSPITLTLSSPATGSLTSSNTLVKWQTTVDGSYINVTELTSWALTFTLDIERKNNNGPVISDQNLAFIKNNGSDNDCSVKFALNSNGTLEFYGYGGSTDISTNSTDVFVKTQTVTNEEGSTSTIIPDTVITL